ncbi:MAG: hypothetical protein M3R59_09370, partial [Verrucomicrobiota bacterium]|nr:hypothetical protein [Verrucomicrobiota bacterium]
APRSERSRPFPNHSSARERHPAGGFARWTDQRVEWGKDRIQGLEGAFDSHRAHARQGHTRPVDRFHK